MEIQPATRKDKDIESRDDSPQPIVIRKLDRVETTKPSSMNGG
jgi:hypothetical protein